MYDNSHTPNLHSLARGVLSRYDNGHTLKVHGLIKSVLSRYDIGKVGERETSPAYWVHGDRSVWMLQGIWEEGETSPGFLQQK